MAQRPTNSLFGQLGFPELSQEQVIHNRTREDIAVFNDLISKQAAALPANDRLVFSSFANLGRNILGKHVAELTDKEKQQFSVMQRANDVMKQQQESEEWKGLDSREKALRSQEAIAQAAMDMGDIDTFTQLSLQTATQRQAFRRADKELDKLDADIEGTEARTDSTKLQSDVMSFNFDRTKEGEQGSFAVNEGAAGFDFSGDPKLVTGKVDPVTGKLIGTNGQEYDSFLTTKDFDMFADNLADDAKTRATGGRSATTSFLTNVGSAERKAARAAVEDIGVQTEIIESVGEVITALDGLQGAEQVVGGAGTLVKGVDSLWRTFRGTAKNINLVMNVGGVKNPDGTYTGGSNKSVFDQEFLEKNIPVDEALGYTAEQAAKYRSAIMQAVYIDARLAEPGARQLSDADIKNAMDRLGVRTNNPASMMKTLMQNMARRTSGVRRKIQTIGEIGEAHGIKADHARNLIFGNNASANVQASMDRMDAVTASIFPDEIEPEEDAPTTTPTVQGQPVDFGDGFTLTPVQ
jgi:hypothetical protein